MLIVHHPDQVLHDPESVFRGGKFIEQPDRAERYHVFLSAVSQDGYSVCEANHDAMDAIEDVHDAGYISFLKTAYKRWRENPGFGPVMIPNVHPTQRMQRKPSDLLGELGWYSNSTSCPILGQTWSAVYASARTAACAADLLLHEGGSVYALCRPPGHHAFPDLMSGMCYLNNAAIAANRLTRRSGKVAILDIDVHHGNGTQFIFWERPDVLFCSIHIDPTFAAPFYAGYAEEVGAGAGRGLTVNIPLPPGTTDPVWLDAVDRALGDVRRFEPAAFVISLGLDASEGDPVAAFKITTDGFVAAARRCASLGVPTLIVQEGGYLNSALGLNLRSFLNAFRHQ